MDSAIPSFEELFRPLIGIPCWNVKKGYGSILTFEFGQPSLRIRQPRDVPTELPRVRKQFARRLVTVRGEWHLWIYCCGWRIWTDGDVLAYNESTDEQIAAACLQIDGQAIQSVKRVPETNHILFTFDLGGTLETGPYSDEVLEQWMLFLPDGNVYTFRSDGAISFGSADQSDLEWVPFS
jgi:hypothetical protein